MRNPALVPALLVLLLAAAPARADSTFPILLTHEGRLLTDADVPVDAAVEMTFILSETDNPGISDPKWTEVHTVPVVKGFYAVSLGDTRPGKGGTAIPEALLLKPEVFLSVKIGGNELQPRMRLGTAAYALRAAEANAVAAAAINTAALADGAVTLAKLDLTQGKFVGLNADLLDGFDSAAFAPASIEEPITAIKTSVGTSVGADVTSVKSEVLTVKTDVKDLLAKIGDPGSSTLATQLAALTATTGGGLGATVTGMNTTLGTVNTGVTNANTTLGTVNSAVSAVSGTVGTINTNVAGLPAILGSPASGTSLTSMLAALQTAIATSTYGWNPANPGTSCKDILLKGGAHGDGTYWIKPDVSAAAFQVLCDMTRDGGGYTLGLKVFYDDTCHGQTGAIGTITDVASPRTTTAPNVANTPGCYKLSDANINNVIGSTHKFDVLVDQIGHNHSYATGNWEYAAMHNYTQTFRFDANMAESSTTTQIVSYRKSDNAVMWIGNLGCGSAGYASGAFGINCWSLGTGNPAQNPAAGTGCTNGGGAPGGNSVNTDWHYFVMGHSNTDTYLYLCNGAQHSSGHNMSHRFWFRTAN